MSIGAIPWRSIGSARHRDERLAAARGERPRIQTTPGVANSTYHLHAALLALLLVGVLIGAGWKYAEQLERQDVRALSFFALHEPRPDQVDVQPSAIAIQGRALQAAAFDQPDLLPIYGSSELLPRSFEGEYFPGLLFRDFPTGFTVFPVGRPGSASLIILQRLAAVGADLRGKKVVISVSPTWLYGSDVVQRNYYLGNFSRQQATELAFSSELSLELKADAARRMLQFSPTLRREPLLRFALQQAASESPISRALYALAFPLGKLQNFIYRLQDHWESLRFLQKYSKQLPSVAHIPLPLDWRSLLSSAQRDAVAHAQGNPYGFDDDLWATEATAGKWSDIMSDAAFGETIRRPRPWQDLDLLLRGVRELGAQPLLIGQPIAGAYFESRGVSQPTRAQYYQRLREAATKYDVPLFTFSRQDGNVGFVVDPSSHLSRFGWAAYDCVLDAFYHDTLDQADSCSSAR
ncbi:MAG: D-alanyl-lipoteichoic acid biosynthesis protein DltD [Chloroflexi bacterium]|nr:D-alanyl-lipoteichoic acid biosynthesis protein DltD [Chloroflexota bacterium]